MCFTSSSDAASWLHDDGMLEISEVSSNTIYLGYILPRGIIRIYNTHITHTAMGEKVYGSRGYKSIKVFSIKVLCKNS